MNITGASGAIPRNDIGRMLKHAKLYYEEIRKRVSDVVAISQNTGFSTEDVFNVKSHVFFNKYDLGDEEKTRFDPDYDKAVSWQRLIDGKSIQEMDIIMLRHELVEYDLMANAGLSYNEAHAIAEAQYNYSQYVRELNRKAGIL